MEIYIKIEVFQQLEKFSLDVCIPSDTKRKKSEIEEKHGFIHIYSKIPKEKRARAEVSVAIRKKKYIEEIS